MASNSDDDLMIVEQKSVAVGVPAVEMVCCHLDDCQKRMPVHAAYTVHLFQQHAASMIGKRYHMTLGEPFQFFCTKGHRDVWLSRQVVRIIHPSEAEQDSATRGGRDDDGSH